MKNGFEVRPWVGQKVCIGCKCALGGDLRYPKVQAFWNLENLKAQNRAIHDTSTQPTPPILNSVPFYSPFYGASIDTGMMYSDILLWVVFCRKGFSAHAKIWGFILGRI